MKTYWEQQALHPAEHVCGESPRNDPNLLLNSGKEPYASPSRARRGFLLYHITAELEVSKGPKPGIGSALTATSSEAQEGSW